MIWIVQLMFVPSRESITTFLTADHVIFCYKILKVSALCESEGGFFGKVGYPGWIYFDYQKRKLY